MYDQKILELRAQGKNWTEIGEEIGWTRDRVRRRYNVLMGNGQEQQLAPAHPDILRLEQRLATIEEKYRQARLKLKATYRKEGLFDQLARTIKAEVPSLPALDPALFQSYDDSEEVTPVDFVLLLSDEHGDVIVNQEATWGLDQYDFNIFRCRLERLRNIIVDYAVKHLPAHRPERLWVFKLGDAAHGDIHGNGPRNHFGNTIKAAIAIGDAEAQVIQSLIPYFPGGVHVVGVSGNHTRRTREKDYAGPHDNFDYLIGVQIATRLAAEIEAGRASVTLPESWSAYVDVRGKVFALNHGDDVRATGGLPWVAFDKRNNRVQSLVGLVGTRVDFFCYGHYHTDAAFRSAGGKSLHNGAFAFTDDYAINKVSMGGEPVQQLYVIGDQPGQRGRLLDIPIYVKDEKREKLLRQGKYEPWVGKESALDLVKVTEEGPGLPLVGAR